MQQVYQKETTNTNQINTPRESFKRVQNLAKRVEYSIISTRRGSIRLLICYIVLVQSL